MLTSLNQPSTMDDEMNKLRSDANNCFVCGPENPIGLKLIFSIGDDDICRSTFTPAENHCGYDGVTHGGIIFSALDDVMANWLFLKGFKAFTAKCEVRYRDALPIGTPVRLEPRATDRYRRWLPSPRRSQRGKGPPACHSARRLLDAYSRNLCASRRCSALTPFRL